MFDTDKIKEHAKMAFIVLYLIYFTVGGLYIEISHIWDMSELMMLVTYWPFWLSCLVGGVICAAITESPRK